MADLNSTYHKNLSENLVVLAEKFPHIHTPVVDFLNKNQLRFEEINQNSIKVVSNSSKGAWEKVFLENINLAMLGDISKQAIVGFNNKKYLLFYKTGLGKSLFYTLQLTESIKASYSDYDVELPIYVIEPNMLDFVMFLGLEIKTFFMKNRLRLFVGSKCLDEYAAFFPENPWAFPSSILVTQKKEDHELLSSIIKDTHDGFLRGAKKSNDAMRYNYKGKDIHYWKTIFCDQRNRPLRVVGITSIFSKFVQYCMRDLLDGFCQLGCHTEMWTEHDKTYIQSNNIEFTEKINRFKPDLIICIDHHRFDCITENVPFINWIQDDRDNFPRDVIMNLMALDFILVFMKKWLNRLDNLPGNKKVHIGLQNVGFNQKIYYPIGTCNKKYDVTYVSHLKPPTSTLASFKAASLKHKMFSEEYDLIDNGVIAESKLRLLYRVIYHELTLLTFSELDLILSRFSMNNVRMEFIGKCCMECNIDFSAPLNQFFRTINRFQRHLHDFIKIKVITHLGKEGFNIKVFGNNWDLYPETISYAKGICKNGKELNMTTNQSKINLNLNPGVSLHMRAAEILGSGAFMLTKRITADGYPLTDFFIENQEVVFFDNENDLVTKVDFFLRNESARETIAQAANHKAKSTLSYDIIAQNMINIVKKNSLISPKE